ncbi:epoxyqueuosine reductase QueH [Fretibacterium sp. OH1220_COT-178]|uniref:epoxyqueuosine reductase QueH n=1 Tax=Fretibacterium sp. OH1220_COT-178 TaxID=2491047 RepID=UPI000F5EC6A8|nr:epoxyqueuosine reductase QueH [Fretibacterium sp. OH1220_COT-178]RRD66025.1 hypothetical protein EII26_01115 [Fretibacterium sp. OH1220_COT-178]
MTRGRMMLHICCAPDATVPVRELGAEGWEVTGFFYGSNIHPGEEYRRRLDALHVLRDHASFPLIAAPYRPQDWFGRMRGLLEEPEGGARCTACFLLQLEAAAVAARMAGCGHLCSSLTISPHKDVPRILRLGDEVCTRHGLRWDPRVWRKRDGFLRSLKLSGELGLYRQNYCGCLPSLSGRELSGEVEAAPLMKGA